MIDLPAARALAELARDHTAAGLTAGEELPDLVDRLADALEALGAPAETRYEWGGVLELQGETEISGPASEKMARGWAKQPWYTALLRRTVVTGPWVEVASEKETDHA